MFSCEIIAYGGWLCRLGESCACGALVWCSLGEVYVDVWRMWESTSCFLFYDLLLVTNLLAIDESSRSGECDRLRYTLLRSERRNLREGKRLLSYLLNFLSFVLA